MRCEVIGDCTLYLGDAMDILPTLGKVDAVVTDPPYGIDFGSFNRTNTNSKGKRYKADKYHNSDWDKQFDLSPFMPVILQCSDKVVIWGGNYFPCLWGAPVKGIVFWYKHQPCKNFSQGEMAWTNLDMPARHIDFPYYGNVEGKTSASEKMHPTQKPVEVMRRCIELTKTDGIILDCFMGSGTTGVACAKMGRKFIGIEREPEYFEIACDRIRKAYAQPDLFLEPPKPKPVQESLC